jgi:hypothetical protein
MNVCLNSWLIGCLKDACQFDMIPFEGASGIAGGDEGHEKSSKSVLLARPNGNGEAWRKMPKYLRVRKSCGL